MGVGQRDCAGTDIASSGASKGIKFGVIDFRSCFRPNRVKAVINTMEMTRRTCLAVVGAALVSEPPLIGKETNTMKEMLESSQNDKKSVTLYLKGAERRRPGSQDGGRLCGAAQPGVQQDSGSHRRD